jgi:site-specific recombinase XerD
LRESQSPYAPLFLLLRQTGMRIGELIHLPPDCVLTNDKGEHYLKVPLGKMNNERMAPLTEESFELI